MTSLLSPSPVIFANVSSVSVQDARLEKAFVDAQSRLTPVPLERLKQIVARLMMHFPLVGENHSRFFNYYVSCLRHYPEDMLCAAYQHVLRHHSTSGTPKLADLMDVMEPEMEYRRQMRDKLERELQHTQEEVDA